MRREIKSFVRRLHRDESGAVFVLVAISIAALLALTALAIDVANLAYAQRRLQATTDAAAQAAALDLNCATGTPGCTTTWLTTANTFSAASGDLNTQRGLNVTTVSVNPYCLVSTGIYYSTSTSTCSGSTSGYNAIEVQQQATVPLIFGHYFGLSSVTITATALASSKFGALPPLHIMLVIDNTGSMNSVDTGPTGTPPTNCGIANPSKLQCALAGAQLLVNQLWPTQDEVGLVVFPPVSTGTAGCTAANGYCEANSTRAADGCEIGNTPVTALKTCSAAAPGTPGTGAIQCRCNGSTTTCVGNGGGNNGYGLPTGEPTGGGCPRPVAYNATGAYVVLTFAESCPSPGAATCYKTSNTATTLNTSSPLAIALCQLNMSTAAETCATGTTTNTGTGEGEGMWVYDYSSTYLVGAINAAQNYLNANSQPGVQNVMIVLSDGGAGNGNGAPPGGNQCIASVTAAENAANAHTWVYSIAYASYTQLSPNANSCSDTETPKISACTTMQKIASDPTKFYSDPFNISPACTSTDNPSPNDIVNIFAAIGTSLTYTQLLPVSCISSGANTC